MVDPSARFSVRARVNAVLAALMVAVVGACFGTSPGRSDVAPQQWWKERGPVVPHDTFPADCSTCHTSSSWAEVRADFHFDHEAETGVPLRGAHLLAECLRCHNDRGPVAGFAERGCAGCHADIHKRQLGTECANCHSENDWVPVGQIAEHNRTRFPLVGAHAATACFQCHAGAQAGNFTRADIECASCHQKDLAQAQSPDHVAQGWVDRCDRCHVPTSWVGAGFMHKSFPLTGAHAGATCADCHTSGSFAGASSSCSSCHADDYDATTNPNHVSAGFSQQCQQCHDTSSWEGAVFDHSSFPLTGGHLGVACAQCHAGGIYTGTPTTCAACHLDDYNATTTPNHATAGYSTDCQSCHDTGAW